MKSLINYIKENLDFDNFAYKFDVWFDSDKEHLEPMLDLMTSLKNRKIVQKDDINEFLLKYPNFKIKKFVDFFDEDVKRDESLNVDYIYIFLKIIENFINNFTLSHKIEYMYQSINNGEPNVEIDNTVIDELTKKEEN